MPSDDSLLHFANNEYFENDRLSHLSATSEQLAGKEFYRCELEGCTLVENEFAGCIFEDCTFVGCDLTMSKPTQAAFRGVRFRECKLMGVNWSEASPGLDVGFERCQLSFGTFMGLSLPKTQFIDCAAKEVNFIDTDLKQSNFRGTNLAGSRFLRANLTKADLSEALDYYIPPLENTVMKARFSMQAAVALAESFGVIVVR